MKITSLFACSFLYVFFGNQVNAAVAPTGLTRNEKGVRKLDDTLASRKETQKQWRDAIEMISERSKLSEAIANARIFSETSVLGKPFDNTSFEQLENSKWGGVMTIVITDHDLELYPGIVNSNNINDVVEVRMRDPPRHQLILLFPQPMSKFWRGIRGQCAVQEARLYTMTPYDVSKIQLNAERHVEVVELANKLLTAIGGEKYDRLLRQEISRIKEIRDMYQTTSRIFLPARYNSALEEIFETSPPRSDIERCLRAMHFHLHAEFTIIQEKFESKGEAEVKQQLADWYLDWRQHANTCD